MCTEVAKGHSLNEAIIQLNIIVFTIFGIQIHITNLNIIIEITLSDRRRESLIKYLPLSFRITVP